MMRAGSPALPGVWGTWLMGGVAIVWLLDSLVGFYLTLPAPEPGGAAKPQKSWHTNEIM
jgi:hypothetical protein